MSDNSTPTNMSSLTSQLQMKLAQDRTTIAKLTSEELEKLAKDLQKKCENVLSTTVGDILKGQEQLRNQVKKETLQTQQTIQRVKKVLQLSWWGAPLTGFCLLLIISIGALGVTHYLSGRIHTQLEMLTNVKMNLVQEQQNLASIRQSTWGLEFQEDQQGRIIILPQGWTIETGWTFGKQEMVRLSPKR